MRGKKLKSGIIIHFLIIDFALLSVGALALFFTARSYVFSKVLMVLLPIIAVFSFAGSFYLSKKISSALNKTNEGVYEYSQGNFSKKIEVVATDELGELGLNINHMATKFKSQINKLKKDNENLTRAFDNITNGLLIVNNLGEIILVNEACKKMLALKEQEITGKSVIEATKNHQISEIVAKAMLGKSISSTVEISYPNKILNIQATPLGDLRTTSGAVIILEDTTAINQLADVKKDFIENVSHELRTPITTINQISEALLAGAKDEPKTRDKFIRDLKFEIDRLSSLAGDILDLSKIESKSSRFKNISLNDLLKESVAVFEGQAGQKNIKLNLDLPKSNILFNADNEQLMKAFTNLLDNSLKYSQKNGQTDISLIDNNVHLLISIKDKGIGIPQKDLNRIFERFYRVDKDRSKMSGGTGLGLAIVKHVIENHQGEVLVKSRLREGTEFIIKLPKKQ